MSKPERSRREAGDFLYPVEVRWGDMDALGHVNNAKYFTYSESARIAWLNEIFAGDEAFMNQHGPILASISCEYHEQLHFPAQLELGVRIEKMGRSSVGIVCPVFRKDIDVAVADIRAIIVWFDYQAQRTIAVPDRLRALWQA